MGESERGPGPGSTAVWAWIAPGRLAFLIYKMGMTTAPITQGTVTIKQGDVRKALSTVPDSYKVLEK